LDLNWRALRDQHGQRINLADPDFTGSLHLIAP
jgi:hypothetical protein